MASEADADGWARVAAAVLARRVQLGLTQEDAAERGGLSATTWRLLENRAQSSYRRLTLAGVERALGWAAGSIAALLDGRDPTEAGHRRDGDGDGDDDADAVVRLRGKVAQLSHDDARAIEALVDRLLADG